MPGPRPCHTCHFTSGAGPDMSGPYKATDPIRRPQLVKAQSPYIFKMHLPQDGPPGAGRPVAAVHFCRQVRVQHGGAFCRAAASCRYARQRAESGGCMAAAALLHGGAGHILPVPPRGAGDWRKMHKSGCRHFSSLHSGSFASMRIVRKRLPSQAMIFSSASIGMVCTVSFCQSQR